MKLHLYYIGKQRDANANAMAQEYVKRLGRYVRCEMAEIKLNRSDPWSKHPAATKILLDPSGKLVDSARLAKLISTAEQQARDLVFVVGGADGLPDGWSRRADLLLSLSPLTFPHELARVMLAEQIYRAFCTLRGHPYPK